RDLGVLKSGKEAEVHLLERRLPAGAVASSEPSGAMPSHSAQGERSCLMAVKRYRTADHRDFHRDVGYLEGRRVRARREMRAMERRSAFGRNLIAQRWALAEFDFLCTLWAAGVPVPYPVQRIGTELMME